MAGTGMPAGEYLELLAARAAQVLDQGRSAAYPRSLAAVTQLAFDRLRAQDPAAAEPGRRLRVPGAGAGPDGLVSPRRRAVCPRRWLRRPPTRWRGGRCWPWSGSRRWPAWTSTGW